MRDWLVSKGLRQGRDYSKQWLRDQIDRLVSEAESQRDQQPEADLEEGQRQWSPGTVVWAKMSGYPYWPARVKRPTREAAVQIAEHGGALVKFYGTHDHLVCSAVEGWETGAERGWRDKPSQTISLKQKKTYVTAVMEALAELEAPGDLSDPPGDENDISEEEDEGEGEGEGAGEEGDEDEAADEEEDADYGDEAAAADEGDDGQEDGEESIIAKKRRRSSGTGAVRKRTGKAARAAAERAAAGEPKRAQNAYMFWSHSVREQFSKDNPTLALGALGKLMGEKWREMGEEEKAPWQAKAAEDKARYEAELAAYNAEHGDTLAQKRAKERAAARGSSTPRKRASSSGESSRSKKAREEADALDLVTAKLSHHVAIGDNLERLLAKRIKLLAKLPEKRAAAVAASDDALVEQCDAYKNELTTAKEELEAQLKVTKGKIAKYTGRYELLTSKKPRTSKPKQPKQDKQEKQEDKPLKAPKGEVPKPEKKVSKPEKKSDKGEVKQATKLPKAAANGASEATDLPAPKRLKKPNETAAGDGQEAALPTATMEDVEEHVTALTAASAAADSPGVEAALAKLERVRMTVELLVLTGAGKAVNKLRKAHPEVEVRARALVERWKALAAAG